MSSTLTAEAARPRPHVAVAPADHVYVDRVVDRDEVDLSAAPTIDLVDWLARGAGAPDVLHLHIGLARIDDLASVRTAARALRLPVVVTLHHHPDLGHDESAIGDLCREAASVIVHDTADAGVLRQRWDIDAYVQPHPHVAPIPAIAAATTRVRRPPWRIGIAPSGAEQHTPVVRTALARVLQTRDDVVAVAQGMHVQDPGHVAAVEWTRTLDALVLTGTIARRAWVELARDLGVAVVAPTAPAVVEPGLVVTYSAHGRLPLEAEVARAISRACDLLPATPIDPATRLEECRRVRDSHTALYRAVSAATGTSATNEDHNDRQDQRNW